MGDSSLIGMGAILLDGVIVSLVPGSVSRFDDVGNRSSKDCLVPGLVCRFDNVGNQSLQDFVMMVDEVAKV